MLEGPPQFRERDEHDTRLDRDYFGFLQRFWSWFSNVNVKINFNQSINQLNKYIYVDGHIWSATASYALFAFLHFCIFAFLHFAFLLSICCTWVSRSKSYDDNHSTHWRWNQINRVFGRYNVAKPVNLAEHIVVAAIARILNPIARPLN
jgi:hypothetical protein